MTAPSYSFLPWLRTGIATRVTEDPGTAERASIPVTLRVGAVPVSGAAASTDVVRHVQLYGPGDVVGIDPRAVSRVEPRQGITNHEPNYLAHIEFYDEDFPWRYSPAVPDPATGRLAPWLALVVLAAGADPGGADAEFTEAGQGGGAPLPSIVVKDPATTLAPPGQLGAWAHVHVNGPLDVPIVSTDPAAALAELAAVLAANPDNACSRVVCPRHLRPDTNYQAFLVPAFETGRLAGLGLDPAGSPAAVHGAWGPHYDGRLAEGQLPYYHRWSFTTGTTGDFEFLVRLLRPRVPDSRVGRRDVDVHRSPGFGIPGIDAPPQINGVLRMGGALRVPPAPHAPRDPFDNWDNFDGGDPHAAPYPQPFQQALAGLVNLAEAYQRQGPAAAHAALAAGPAEGDPVITPPLYGRWHALTSRLLTGADGTPVGSPTDHNWVHRLNLDPRFRAAAGLGTQVVQARQEELMAAAWAQVGDVLAANGRIRAAQLAREVGHMLQTRHLDPLPGPAAARSRPPGGPPTAAAGPPVPPPVPPSGRSLRLTAPAHPRVTAEVTPGGAGFAAPAAGPGPGLPGLPDLAGLVERVAVGFRVATSQVAAAPVSPAMRRITRPGSRLMRSLPFTDEQPADALLPRMDSDTDPVTAAPPKLTPAGVVTAEQLDTTLHPPPPGLAAQQGAAADPVGSLPTSSDFTIRDINDPATPTPGGPDSPEALNFKKGLHELFQARDTAVAVGRTAPRPRLDVPGATGTVLDGLRADLTVPRSLLGAVNLPQRLQPFAEAFIEAMAYPVFDLPTYRPLLDLGVEAFVPNLGLIPANSITLLENNREFIESYLVGLNHEMARELLWREYPTDQRGSPFRQFWDPRAMQPVPAETPAQRRERGYDIPPVHRWPPAGQLGQNDNRQAPGRIGRPQQDDLVLVIRGELLKKYPTTAIYAQRAAWPPGPSGPDTTQQRVLVDLDQEDALPPEVVRLPLYEAKIEPDIYLLGFDLDAEQARGNPPTDAGWFFVLKERPGDPRFGADDGDPTRVEVWNDLTWADIDPAHSGFIELDPNVSVPLADFDGSDDDPEKQQQRDDDANLPLWYAGLGSADLAYILFQVPVLVAVHAQEMLPS
jgi:hypothetical protein